MLTKEVRKQVIREFVNTWDYIGADVLNSVAMEKVGYAEYNKMNPIQQQRANESVTMSQLEVVCVVVDNWYGKDKENGELWSGLLEKEKVSIKKEAFPFKHYGY